MKRITRILAAVVVISLLAWLLLYFFCPNKCNCRYLPPPVPKSCDKVLYKIGNGRTYKLDDKRQITKDTSGNPILGNVEVKAPYRCNEVILDGSHVDASKLRDHLRNLCFVKVNECRCSDGGPELWQYAGNASVDLIGVVKDPPPTGGGVGGLMLNFIVEDFTPPGDTISFVDSSAINSIEIPAPISKCSNESVKIAIVDSGVDVAIDNPLKTKGGTAWKMMNLTASCHPALATVFGLDMDPVRGPEPEDKNGHGTHINGIVVGLTKPSSGASEGVQLEFVNARFTDGTKKDGSLFHAMCGLYYAMEQGAEVINVSWGFYDDEVPLMLEKIIQEAHSQNVMIVAGMGNKGLYLSTTGERFWPACFANHPNLISVGAVVDETSNTLADFSNWSHDLMVMTVTAVGKDVISTFPMHLTPSGTLVSGQPIVRGWVKQSGTSMAAPYVTRTVAVMKGIGKKDPTFTVVNIKNRILSNASARPWRQYDHQALNSQMCAATIPIN